MNAQILILAIQLAQKALESMPEIRAALSTEDKATLDAVYADFRAASNATADRLRATPED